MGSIEAVSGGYRGRGEVPQFHASPVQPPLGHLLGGAVREEQWTYVPKPGSMVPPCPCLVVPFSTPSHECSASLSSLRQEWAGQDQLLLTWGLLGADRAGPPAEAERQEALLSRMWPWPQASFGSELHPLSLNLRLSWP